MTKPLIRIAISLAVSALALGLAALMLSDFHLEAGGFVVAVLVLTVAQAVLAPIVAKLTERFAGALMGGVGIISTLIALLLTALVPGGITVTSPLTWVLAAFIVWICTSLGGWLLVALVVKRRRSGGKGEPA